jgi:hypothetical protein
MDKTSGKQKSIFFLGERGRSAQETFISDEPLIIDKKDFAKITKVVETIVSHIEVNQPCRIGDPWGRDLYKEICEFDSRVGSEMVFGGLDVYKDQNGEFKVLRIDPSVQSSGLQTLALENLGIKDQPTFFTHMLEFVRAKKLDNVMILGGTTSVYWRTLALLATHLKLNGIKTVFGDTSSLVNYLDSGFEPKVFFRFCSSWHILRHVMSQVLKNYSLENKIPIYNSLYASLVGDNVYLTGLSEDLPHIFPKQVDITLKVDEKQLEKFPWLKVEASGYRYVVNFNNLQRWAKNCLISLIDEDYSLFDKEIKGRTNSDATKIIDLKKGLEKIGAGKVKWIAQEHINPDEKIIKVGGKSEKMKILYKAYWVKVAEGDIRISLEGAGCVDSQYYGSKGKINSGSGIVIPIISSL